MQDYESILRRAIAELDPDTPEQRQQVFARARASLNERMRDMTVPFAADAIRTEMAALDAAIRRIQSTIAPGAVAAAVAEDEASGREHVRDVLHPWYRRLRVAAVVALVLGLGGAATYLLWPAPPAPQPAPNVTDRSQVPESELPYFFKRQPVYYRTTLPAGTIVVQKLQSFLYVVQPNQVALRYGIALGGDCAALSGMLRVTQKQEPLVAAIGAGEQKMPGSFTEQILYLSEEPGRIHSARSPKAIGYTISAGCIQVLAADMGDLYGRVPLGTRVVVGQ